MERHSPVQSQALSLPHQRRRGAGGGGTRLPSSRSENPEQRREGGVSHAGHPSLVLLAPGQAPLRQGGVLLGLLTWAATVGLFSSQTSEQCPWVGLKLGTCVLHRPLPAVRVSSPLRATKGSVTC